MAANPLGWVMGTTFGDELGKIFVEGLEKGLSKRKKNFLMKKLNKVKLNFWVKLEEKEEVAKIEVYDYVNDYSDTRLAEIQNTVSQGLFAIGSSSLDSLRVQGEDVSNEYADIVAVFARNATDVAKILTTAQITPLDATQEQIDELAKMSPEDKIRIYSEGIQDGWIKEAEKIKNRHYFPRSFRRYDRFAKTRSF